MLRRLMRGLLRRSLMNEKLIIGGNNTSLVRTATLPGGLTKEARDPSSTRLVTTQNVAAVETEIIWNPHVVDGRSHHILEKHSGLKYLAIAASILMTCVLPLDSTEVMKLGDNQLLQQSESSRYRTDVADRKVKRCLGEARNFIEIFFVLKVQTLEEAKVVLKSVIEEQNVSVNQSNEIKSLKKLLEEAETEKTAAKQKVIETEEKDDRGNKDSKDWADKHEKLRLSNIVTIKYLEGKVKANADLDKKWLNKVLQFLERLEILNNNCPDLTFNCKEWDAIYTSMRISFLLRLLQMLMLSKGKLMMNKMKLLLLMKMRFVDL